MIVWQRGGDYLFVAFYPNAATGRLQMKAFMPASGCD